MNRRQKIEYVLLAAIVLVAAFLRFYGLNYAIGTHPDERHMVYVTQSLSLENLNPKSFAYGSFPYYLTASFSWLLGLVWPYLASYDGIFMVGRSVCALTGILAVILTWLVARQIFGNTVIALAAAFLLAVNPFHIQLSRFFTSDIILTTSLLASLSCLIALANGAGRGVALLLGACLGISLATKVSALLFLVLVPIAFILSPRFGTLRQKLSWLIITAIVTAIVTFLLQPYAVLDYGTFISHTREQTRMARGLWRPPYTIQYEHTLPYLYHLEQMFFYTLGWPVFLAALAGLAQMLYGLVRRFDPARLLFIIWGALFFGAIAGLQVKFPRYLLPMYPWLAILAAVGVLAPVFRETSLSSSSAHPRLHPRVTFREIITRALVGRRSALYWGSTIAAFLLFGASIAFSASSSGGRFALFIWIAGLAAMGFALTLRKLREDNFNAARAWKFSLETALLAGLMLFFIVIRLVALSEFPLRLHNDEMTPGLVAQTLYMPNPPAAFGSPWLGLTQLPFSLISVVLQLGGDGLYALRLSSAIFGLLSLILAYLLMRRLFGRDTALLGLFLLGFFHPHLHFSRTGFVEMIGLALSLLGLYGAAVAFETRRSNHLFWAGAALALALTGGSLGWITAVTILVLCLLERQNFRTGAIIFGWAILALTPFILSGILNGHLGFLAPYSDFIFRTNNLRHLAATRGLFDVFSILSHQFGEIGKFIISGGDFSLQYGFNGRFIDPFTLIFFLGGTALAIKGWRASGNRLLLIWFAALVLFKGILSVDAPFAPRVFAVMIPVAAFSAAALADLAKFVGSGGQRWRTYLAYLVVIFAVLSSSAWNLVQYFAHYPAMQTAAPRDRIVRLLEEHPDVSVVVNTYPQAEDFQYESYRFIRPNLLGFNLGAEQGLDELPLTNLTSQKSVLILGDRYSDGLAKLPLSAYRRNAGVTEPPEVRWTLIYQR